MNRFFSILSLLFSGLLFAHDTGIIQLGNNLSDRTWRVICTHVTTVSGTATFYMTDDGTATGNALFNMIHAVASNALFNTNLPNQVPLMSTKSISADNKIIVFNVVQGQALINNAVLPLKFVPDGTVVYARISGT